MISAMLTKIGQTDQNCMIKVMEVLQHQAVSITAGGENPLSLLHYAETECPQQLTTLKDTVSNFVIGTKAYNYSQSKCIFFI
jgi:hypothetical protein